MSRKVQKNLFLFWEREWKEDINVQMYNSILHSTVNWSIASIKKKYTN